MSWIVFMNVVIIRFGKRIVRLILSRIAFTAVRFLFGPIWIRIEIFIKCGKKKIPSNVE